MDQNQPQENKSYLEEIPADELHKFVFQSVVYKVTDTHYKNVILGQQIKGTDYYKAYTGKDGLEGIVCSKNSLYRRLSENSMRQKK